MSNKQTAVQQIKDFLYSEICERREYSASRMCEEVLKFINQIETGDNNSRKIKATTGGSITVNNNPEIKWSVGNSDAVNSYNLFNTRANTTWTKMFNDNVLLEKNRVTDGIPAPWDRDNMVNTEEKTPYIPTSTNTIHVSKPDKTDDGTIATIEITIDIKQR